MKIIVGLGNPGARYSQTHHNIGFLAVDYLVRAWNARGPIEKYKGQIWQAKVSVGGGAGAPGPASEDVLLVQPQTFMNLSGECVGQFMRFYKCAASDLIVIHDELDLDPGVLRIKEGGGNGGHNGLKSIDEHVGAELRNYVRIRLGIGHPRRLNLPMDVADFVLMKFRPNDFDVLDEIFRDVEGCIKLILEGKIRVAMNQYHGQASGAGRGKLDHETAAKKEEKK